MGGRGGFFLFFLSFGGVRLVGDFETPIWVSVCCENLLDVFNFFPLINRVRNEGASSVDQGADNRSFVVQRVV